MAGDYNICGTAAAEVLRQLVASAAEAELSRMHRAKVFEAQASEAPRCRVRARDGRQFHHINGAQREFVGRASPAGGPLPVDNEREILIVCNDEREVGTMVVLSHSC